MAYKEPPIFNLPRGESILGVNSDIGNYVLGIMQENDARQERDRARQEQEKAKAISDAIQGEEMLLRLAPILSGFAPDQPVDLAAGAPTAGPEGLPLVPKGAPTSIPLGGGRLAEPLLDELTLPSGQKIRIPPVRGTAEQSAAEAQAAERAKMEAGTEVLSPEVWANLPAFYKSRWKPGQRISSKDVGAIGMETFKKAGISPKAPTSRHRAGRVEEWNPETRTWNDVGPSEAPGKPSKKTFSWVTDDKGERVRVSDDDIDAAPPGKYSDVRPTVEKAAGASKDRMAQSQASASKILGAPNDNTPDSLWTLAVNNTLPGPSGAVGPLAKLAGIAGSLQVTTGAGPQAADLESYNSQVEGFMPLFARAVGHTGNLTERDLKRTGRLFPVLTGRKADTREVAIRKLNRIKALMSGEETPPASLFDTQPGAWPPEPAGAAPKVSGGAPPISGGAIPGDMESLLKEYGY